MNEKIGKIIGPETQQEIKRFMQGVSKKEGIWRPAVREVSYKGIKGEIYYYYDGIADHIFFVGFPLGRKWNKLSRSLQALKRETPRGRYEVEIGEEGKGARVSLFYSETNYPQQPGKSFLETRFKEMWQDLENYLPDEGVVLGEPGQVKEFDLQDFTL